MEAIRAIQVERCILRPDSAPRIACGKELRIYVLGGRGVGMTHAVEILRSGSRWPDHKQRRPRARGPDFLIETLDVFAKQYLRLGRRRWSLLQHDQRPSALSD